MSSLSKKLSRRMKADSPTKSPSIVSLKNKTKISLDRFSSSIKKADKLQACKEVVDGQKPALSDDEANIMCSETQNSVSGKRKTAVLERRPGTQPGVGNVRSCAKPLGYEPETVNPSNKSRHNEQDTAKSTDEYTANEHETEHSSDEFPATDKTTNEEQKVPFPNKADKSDSGDLESELPTFKNSINKTFYLDLTEEVKDYVKEISAKFADETEKNPTVAEVKYVGQKALSVLLRYNDRGVSKGATKEEVAKMVHDHMQHGVPPRCPKCKRGSLRFSNGKKKAGKRYYWCPGSTTNGRAFYGCNFKAQKNEIQRIPWKNPQ